MLHHRLRHAAHAAAVAFSFAFIFAVTAFAAEGAKNQPGQFDFYVLSLSWSPSYCAEVNERGRSDQQCATARPYAFIVHGLWPQYDKGFPSDCQRPAPRIGRDLVSGMLDLMPSRHLVYHEWDTHGTCSGLSAPDYFATVRKARAAVNIPDVYSDPTAPMTVTPAAVAAAFVKANAGLADGDLAVTCNRTRLSEVRLCLDKDLKFRGCPAVAKASCKRAQVMMPAVRGK